MNIGKDARRTLGDVAIDIADLERRLDAAKANAATERAAALAVRVGAGVSRMRSRIADAEADIAARSGYRDSTRGHESKCRVAWRA